MQKLSLSLLFLVSCFLIFSCVQEKKEKQNVLAKINDSEISIQEYEDLLAEDLNQNNGAPFSKEKKQEFLEQIIRKDLLLQEAERLKLDQSDTFLKAIKRYREAILIKELLGLKNEEFSKNVIISKEEITARYNLIKETNKDIASLNKLEPIIVEEIKEQKTHEKIKVWMKELRENSEIYINDEFFNKDR